jgi:hypothetical protein
MVKLEYKVDGNNEILKFMPREFFSTDMVLGPLVISGFLRGLCIRASSKRERAIISSKKLLTNLEL